MTMDDVTFREGLEFIAPLMEQSARDLAFTTNSLLDSLAMECAENAARLQLIGEAVEDLLHKPYAPSAHAIEGCLYPDLDTLAMRTQQILTSRGIHSSTHGKG